MSNFKDEQEKIEELINQLNKEYGGSIKIGGVELSTIPVNQISYIGSIMDNINPIDNDTPIVVAEESWRSSGYKVIDGYHRLKGKLDRDTIDVVIINSYSIDRGKGEIIDLLQSSIGKKLTFISNEVMKVAETLYEIETNEGCGGCSSGWSSLEVAPEFVGKEVEMKTVTEDGSDEEYEDTKTLIVNGKKIAELDYGWGNGYYGGGFDLVEVKDVKGGKGGLNTKQDIS